MMANDWDEYAADWEKDQSTTFFTQQAFADLVKCVDLNGMHVLDFGCGTGLLSQCLSPRVKSIVALDASEAMVEELDKKWLTNVEPVVDYLTRGLVAQHPAFRKQFDLVVASSVCGFLPDLSQALNIIYSLLDDDGVFVHWDWLVADDDPEFGLTLDDVKEQLKSAGFKQVTVSPSFEISTTEGIKTVLMGVARK
jgi:2-polyprenyl-3-methyl-5-hydroxy-6-metoxy-1,4-benzoquinol methylase